MSTLKTGVLAQVRRVPSTTIALFVTSVVLMNLLANKELATGVSWLALDCGFSVSWLSFLVMDIVTKQFGPRVSISVTIFALGVNLLVCAVMFGVSMLPGNWGAYYSYGEDVVNTALNSTVGGTWYVLLGSTTAFLVSSILNAFINSAVGKLFKRSTFGAFAARSYISTLVAQFADNLVFAFMVSYVFFGWSVVQCITSAATGCVIELLCEVVFSPLGYRISKNWEKLKWL